MATYKSMSLLFLPDSRDGGHAQARLPSLLSFYSAAAHVGRGQPSPVPDMSEWQAVWTAGKWREQLIRPEDAKELARMRLSTHRGRPVGSDGFLSKLEHRLGRLRPLAVGRPRKKAEAKRELRRRRQARRVQNNG